MNILKRKLRTCSRVNMSSKCAEFACSRAQAGTPTGAQKRNIVRTGEQVPYEWAAAQVACNFGVRLEKGVVYTGMPESEFYLPAGMLIEYAPQPNLCH